jgi:hypothetical protein
MRKEIIISTILFLTTFVIISCSKENDDNGGNTLDCSTVPKTYSADVSPVITSSCGIAGCHASGSGNGPGALTNYNQVFNARSSIRSSVASGRMPQGSSLSTAQKNSILCWIDSGAPNN